MPTKPIPSDEVTVTYRGQTVKFHVYSLNWEDVGCTGDPIITLRGRGPRHLRIKVQLPSSEDAFRDWAFPEVE
jgi:hypothetical protein